MFSAAAAVIALVPAIFGRKVPQLLGASILALSLVLVYSGYPELARARADFQQRSKAKSDKPTAPPAPSQEERK